VARRASGLAAVLAVALVAWSAGLSGWVATVHALDVTNFSNQLSSSQPGVVANHTITFTLSGAVDEGETLTVEFESGFDLSALAYTDIDIASSSNLTTAANCVGSEEVAIAIVGQVITFEICAGDGGTLATGTAMTILIGTNADAGEDQIVNPSTQRSYTIDLGGTAGVTGQTRVAIVDTVLVSAAVSTVFDFQILGVDAATSTNGDAVLTSATSTDTLLPFGTLTAGVPKVLAQDLTVNTNAVGGFAVTVQADQTLTSTNGSEIELFVDGSATGTPTAWVPPSVDPGDTTTYGHWGLTTEDENLSTGNPFGTALYVGDFVDVPREVFYHDGPSDGQTPHIGRTRVGYKIETSILQGAASDYQAQLTYIATPLF
jgi:hypothetical protein